MNYVGVDLPKQTISVGVVGQARDVRCSRRFRCDDELGIVEFFTQLVPSCRAIPSTSSRWPGAWSWPAPASCA